MTKTIKIFASFAAILVIMNVVSCKKLSSYDYPDKVSVYGIIKDDFNFTTFRYIIDRAGLKDVFDGKDQYTVFAPTNGAFSNAGYTTVTLQAMSTEELKNLVKNHLVAGKIDVNTFNGSQEVTSAGNLKFTLKKIGDAVYIDGGDIINTNKIATNGTLNMINKLLVSRGTLNDIVNNYVHGTVNSQLTILAAAIARASTGSTNFTDLLTGSNQYTFFAPNNGALAELGYTTVALVQAANPDVLGNMLKYQLIAGRKLTTDLDSIAVNAFNGTPVYFDKVRETRTTYWYANGISFGNGAPSNLLVGNGVMHIVSRVFPAPITTTTLARIQSDANLSTFYALIQRASMADPKFNFTTMLSDPKSSYTVYAINNAGLLAQGYADAAAINAETPETLAKLLKLHIIPKRINNINIGENGTAVTLSRSINPSTGLEEKNSIVFIFAGGYKVKGANNPTTIPVITGNVVTTNGLLNIIGTVMRN